MGITIARLAVVLVMAAATTLMSAVPTESAEQAARVFQERVRGLTVVVVAEGRVDDCMSRTVAIVGRTAGHRNEVSYEEFIYNECTDDEQEVRGTARPTVFEIEALGQLRRAHLVADIRLEDGRVVHVDETFTGFGAIYRDTLVNVVNDDGFHFLSTRLERYRDAHATGTLTASQAYMLYTREGLLNVCIPRVSSDGCYSQTLTDRNG